jgi:transcriptional regulator with XRE-family HTH domain
MVNVEKEILLMQLSKRLKELRKEKGVTQLDVLNDTGILISRIEQGKRDVSIYSLFKLCKYFDITLSSILENKAHKN